MNDFKEKSAEYKVKASKEAKCSWTRLEGVQKKNERAQSRCVGLVLETRPDFVTKDEVLRLRRLGATKIQIGVQSLDDKVLKINARGHSVSRTAQAFKLLRQAGFKIHAHWMPNLMDSSPSKDVRDFRKLFSDLRFKPDELKIYPCSLIGGTKLMDFYEDKRWVPYSEEGLMYVLKNCLKAAPRWCRITRVVRDISSEDIVVGNKKSNFRQMVEEKIRSEKGLIKEIRYREIKNEKVALKDLKLLITRYKTSNSEEYFLEYVTSEDKIVGFLRLSLPTAPLFIPELRKTAIIREIHVYGQTLDVGQEDSGKSQHMGIGTKLIEKAVEITKRNKINGISVISSIGTKVYYRKHCFSDGPLYQHRSV